MTDIKIKSLSIAEFHAHDIIPGRRHGIPGEAQSPFHEARFWLVAEGSLVLGVVVRDRIDNDYGWVLIAGEQVVGPSDEWEVMPSGYRAVDLKMSLPTEVEAGEDLTRAIVELLHKEVK
jgi:hypothetical protein